MILKTPHNRNINVLKKTKKQGQNYIALQITIRPLKTSDTYVTKFANSLSITHIIYNKQHVLKVVYILHALFHIIFSFSISILHFS